MNNKLDILNNHQYIRKKEKNVNSFTIYTYTVKPVDKNNKILKFGPDDQTYYNNPELIELVPRACSYLYNNNNFITELHGLTKFDGTNNNVDEDEYNSENNQQSLINMDIIKELERNNSLEVKVVEKENGKFAIFKYIKIDEKYYLFGGSKNVHEPILIDELKLKNKDDLKDLHYKILYEILKDTENIKDELLDKPIIGEYVDGMHIVYTDKPYMVYFNDPTGKLRRPNEFFTEDKNFDKNKMLTEEYLKKIRNLENTEGCVINYIDKSTGKIYRQKHKSIWYIILRVAREAISKYNKNNINKENLYNNVVNRIKKRSCDFLNLTDEEMKYWFDLINQFINWLYLSKIEFNDLSPFSNVGFAYVWDKFSKYKKFNNIEEFQENKENKENKEKKEELTPELILVHPEIYYNIIENALKLDNNITVILSGLPGSGKSTISNMLKTELEKNNIQVEIFSTDSYFYDENKHYNFDISKLGVNHMKNLLKYKESTTRVKILDNTNLYEKDIEKYYDKSKKILYFKLQTKLDNLNNLERRNIHNVKYKKIYSMSRNYTIDTNTPKHGYYISN